MKKHGHLSGMLAALTLFTACYALAATSPVPSAERFFPSLPEAAPLIHPGVSHPEPCLVQSVNGFGFADRVVLPCQEQKVAAVPSPAQLADNEEDDGEENGGDGEKDDAADSGGGGNPERIWDRVKRG